MRNLVLAPLLAAGLLCPCIASAQAFSLQQVTSGPFSSQLMAAPQGERLAWVVNERGARNLMVAEGAASGWTHHALTHYTADDGMELGDMAWAPDGKTLVYVRGGDFEFPGKPAPNPALDPAGVKQEIWAVPVAGGEPRRLAEGRAPAVSPDGKTVAFLNKGEVYAVELGADGAKPVELFHARGELGSLAWSPDGHALVFTSARGDHAFVGVYAPAAHTLVYLDPSTEIDAQPVWSPDSKQVAFVRLSRADESLFKPRRSGVPWAIRVADAGTGSSHEVWRAQPGQGSVFRGVDAPHQLWWAAGDRIVFPWEGDGWLHLYAVSAGVGGAKATLLTPGDGEVENVALSADRKEIAYSSNANAGGATGEQDIDRRHIWLRKLDAPAPTSLTRGEGLETSPQFTASGTVAMLRADWQVPQRAAVLEAGGAMRDLAPELVPKDFPASRLVKPQQVILSAADGMRIHAQIFLPADGGNARRPAVVFFHGGSQRQMLLGWHYREYYSNAYAMNQYLASLGYVVLSVNYRSGIGYGMQFREALNYGAAGASEFNDVQGAGLYLRSRADVDPARIGVWGGSYGGYLTALALARSSDMFAAGVDLHGVHDWNLGIQTFDPLYRPDPDTQRLATESSPIAAIKTWRSPVLLIQGDDDRNVSFSQTVRLAHALREQGVDVEEHVFPDEIHDFLLYRDWVEAYTLGAEFLGRKLRGGR